MPYIAQFNTEMFYRFNYLSWWLITNQTLESKHHGWDLLWYLIYFYGTTSLQVSVVFGTDPKKDEQSLRYNKRSECSQYNPSCSSRHKTPAHYGSGSCATYSVLNILELQLVPTKMSRLGWMMRNPTYLVSLDDGDEEEILNKPDQIWT